MKPDLISYDHYHYVGELAREIGSERSVVDSRLRQGDNVQYFLNLALVREAALKGGVPFVNVVQTCALGPGWRTPNGDEGRSLAYGGQASPSLCTTPVSILLKEEFPIICFGMIP